MSVRELSNDSKITMVAAPAAAGTGDTTGSIVDMAGWNSVMFLTSFGTAAAGNTMHCEQDTDVAGGTMADLEGSSLGVGSSDETIYYDLHNPRERYVRVVVTRGTSSTLGAVYAIQYNRSGNLPADNTTAGTIYGEAAFAPAEGTA